MPEEKENKEVAKIKGLPGPLGWLAGFIDKYFIQMPQWVQVVVFLVFTLLIATVFFNQLFPDTWDSLFSKPVELHGEIKRVGNKYFGSDIWTIEIARDNFYLAKRKIADDCFSYDWILKVPRSELKSELQFNILKYCQVDSISKLTYLFSRNIVPESMLSSNRHEGGKVLIELDVDREYFKLLRDSSASGWCYPELINNPEYPQKNKAIRLSADSTSKLIRKWETEKDPYKQKASRDILTSVDTGTVRFMAESLKTAVFRRNNRLIISYSQLLANYPSLAQFTSNGKYSGIFNSKFHGKAVEILIAQNEAAGRSLSWFLRKLQDSRSIDSIYRAFDKTREFRVKKLCLLILEGFANNRDSAIRKKVRDQLKDMLIRSRDETVRREISFSLKYFEERK